MGFSPVISLKPPCSIAGNRNASSASPINVGAYSFSSIVPVANPDAICVRLNASAVKPFCICRPISSGIAVISPPTQSFGLRSFSTSFVCVSSADSP